MVRSNVRDMPKRRKIKDDPEFRKALEELDRRAVETDQLVAETLARADEVQRKLREAIRRGR